MTGLLILVGRAAVAQQRADTITTPGTRSAVSVSLATLPAAALVAGEPVVRLSLADFVALVGRQNLDYAAQAYNVPVADAQVSVAHLYPNPSISWGAGFDVSGQHQATSYDIALTQSILFGGKRGAHTDVARRQLAATKAQLDDFLRTLRGTAATAYADAVHAEQVYARKRQTADELDRLVMLNQRRVSAGDAAEIDLVQSRVDAGRFHGELVAAANDVHATRLAMTGLLTPRAIDTLAAPTTPIELVSLPAVGPDVPMTPALLGAAKPPAAASGAGQQPPFPSPGAVPSGAGGAVPAPAPIPGPGPTLPVGAPPVTLDVDSLTRAAVLSRPDVVAARRLREASDAGIRVAGSNRWSDIDLTLGTSYFTRGTSAIDPTPVFSSINVGLSFPIPLSNFSHGELASARYTAKQAAAAVQSAEWKAAIDVHTVWTAYVGATVQLAQYSGGILLDAERVRRAKLYSYQHGSASLLDVLTAEQTANDVYLASYDAQQQYAHALIGLGQATDTWSFVYAVVDQPTR